MSNRSPFGVAVPIAPGQRQATIPGNSGFQIGSAAPTAATLPTAAAAEKKAARGAGPLVAAAGPIEAKAPSTLNEAYEQAVRSNPAKVEGWNSLIAVLFPEGNA